MEVDVDDEVEVEVLGEVLEEELEELEVLVSADVTGESEVVSVGTSFETVECFEVEGEVTEGEVTECTDVVSPSVVESVEGEVRRSDVVSL